MRVENRHPGIYRVHDGVLFPTQIIVSKELEAGQHTWLRSLSDRIEEGDMRRLLADVLGLRGKLDKEFADSILEVSLRANGELIERLKGDENMSEALLEIMEPVIIERERLVEIRARREGMDHQKMVLSELWVGATKVKGWNCYRFQPKFLPISVRIMQTHPLWT